MSCDKCSSVAPPFPRAGEKYTCSFCNQTWRLAEEGPGSYWEQIEKYNSEKAFVAEIIQSVKQ